jgi:hypothetical protein
MPLPHGFYRQRKALPYFALPAAFLYIYRNNTA